jgi:hypothetical protein
MIHAKSKTLIIIFIYLLLSIVWVQAQEESLTSGVTIHEEGASAGYILFSPTNSPMTYLIDDEGRLIHQWQGSAPVLLALLLENGHIMMGVQLPSPRFSAGITGRIEEYDWDGNLVWSFDYLSDTSAIHHSFEVMPNGNVLLSAWELVSAEQALALGLRPELLPQVPTNIDEGRIQDDALWLDMLLEVDRESGAVVWEWHMQDHLIQDYTPDAPNYAIVSDYPGRIDLNYALQQPSNDRTHFNALDYHADLDQILVSSPSYSEIWVIDHAPNSTQAAGSAGDLLYRWGNPQVYRRGTVAERQLFFQHDAHWLPDGNIILFNNGQRGVRPYSSIVEIVPPLRVDGTYELQSGAAYDPLAPRWLYEAVPPENFFAPYISGAQRLPNGNTFITDGSHGRLFEVMPLGEIVWEYLNPIFLAPDPERRSAIFRATAYPPAYPAFANHQLLPGEPLPLSILDEVEGQQ